VLNAQSFIVAAIQIVSNVPSCIEETESAIIDNMQTVERLVAEAAKSGAELVVLPENVLTFGSRKPFTLEAQQQWLAAFSVLAQHKGIWLVAGSLPLSNFQWQIGDNCKDLEWSQATGLPYATTVVFDKKGKLRGVYQKNHLFDANIADATGQYRESDIFQRGRHPAVVETPWGKMGIAICFDLRFPQYFQQLRALGTDFIVLPSAFTYTTGKAHWEILLRARAIENQTAMVGVNQGGDHDSKRKTWGDSMIVDAWGNVLARVGNALTADDSQLGESIVLAELKLAGQRAIRESMPLVAPLP